MLPRRGCNLCPSLQHGTITQHTAVGVTTAPLSPGHPTARHLPNPIITTSQWARRAELQLVPVTGLGTAISLFSRHFQRISIASDMAYGRSRTRESFMSVPFHHSNEINTKTGPALGHLMAAGQTSAGLYYCPVSITLDFFMFPVHILRGVLLPKEAFQNCICNRKHHSSGGSVT